MNYPESHILNLIAGIMPFLNKEHSRLEKTTADGHYIMAKGVYQDIDGNMITRGREFTAMVPKPVKVNHEKKIRAIIKKATSPNKMTDALGEYVAKNGLPPVNKNIVTFKRQTNE
jgi:hypothetical protein